MKNIDKYNEKTVILEIILELIKKQKKQIDNFVINEKDFKENYVFLESLKKNMDEEQLNIENLKKLDENLKNPKIIELFKMISELKKEVTLKFNDLLEKMKKYDKFFLNQKVILDTYYRRPNLNSRFIDKNC